MPFLDCTRHRIFSWLLAGSIFTGSLLAAGCTAGSGNRNPETQISPVQAADPVPYQSLQPSDRVIVYYFSSFGDYLFPATRKVLKRKPAYQAALDSLFKGPKDFDLAFSFLPEDLYPQEAFVLERTMYLDFGPQLSDSLSARRLVEPGLRQLVYTMTEFDDVEAVQILGGGKAPVFKIGNFELWRPLSRPPVINPAPLAELFPTASTPAETFPGAGSGFSSVTMVPVKLYFHLTGTPFVVPTTRFAKAGAAPGNRSEYLVPILRELLTGPSQGENRVKGIFPEGTNLRGVYSDQESVARVDFGPDILSAVLRGSTDGKMAVEGLVLTLTELPGIQRVQIMVGGKVVGSFPGYPDVARPMARPRWINPWPGEF
ncbi:MAG: GerMN domain-containing protein [Firmicutes bacterium]|nr:GerMN domain-containing protein [Bacillota bacterium]